MADVAKPVEVPETKPAVTEPAVEAKPLDSVPATETPAADTPAVAATESKPAEVPAAESAAAPVEETTKEEAKPVEEGHLEHKGSPANFPKNFIYSKQLFWFGSEPVTAEKLGSYLKAEKATDVAHHVTSWASETGKGLLFYGDKSKPAGVIQLAEASEPTTEGHNKFALTTKGHKHAFKAGSSAERDNWVSQIKAKIVEAKELATTVTESETYKSTLESLKPKKEVAAEPVKDVKKDAPVEASKDAQETPAEPVQEPAAEAVKQEQKDDAKVEEPKRRSASRKRASIFGNLLGKKEGQESKKEKEASPEPTPVEPLAADAAPVAANEPVVDAPVPASSETPAVEPVKDEPAVEQSKESKPVPVKRNSIFGNLSFGKKKVEPEASKKEESQVSKPEESAPVAETAPVIPAVETTEPLSAEVASPANVPTETVEASSPVVNGESKKEKRKSSLPFNFGKKDKVVSDEEGEKSKKTPGSPPFFSKLRQTVKGGKKSEKAAEPVADEPSSKPAETVASEEQPSTSKPVEAATEDKPAEEQPVEGSDKPAVPAATPVTAAA